MQGQPKFTKKSGLIVLILGIITGLAFMLYPLVSQLYYDQEATSEVTEFQQAAETLDPPEQKAEKVAQAEAYNEALEPNLRWIDPYSEEERAQGVRTYAKMIELKEKVGILNVPDLSLSLPIYAGTNESVLQRGVGHLEGTSLPVGGENTHSVLTAHRGLPEARLFTDLDKLAEGDIFYVETMAGELYYEVDNIQIVEPTQTDTIRIVPGEDYLTLLTCTPYMINSHRLLVRGHRIPAPPKEVIEEAKETQNKNIWYYLTTYWYYLLVFLVGLMIIVYVIRRPVTK